MQQFAGGCVVSESVETAMECRVRDNGGFCAVSARVCHVCAGRKAALAGKASLELADPSIVNF